MAAAGAWQSSRARRSAALLQRAAQATNDDALGLFVGRRVNLRADVDKQARQVVMPVESTDGLRREAMGRLACLLYTSPSPRDRQKSRMPSSA